MAMMLTNAGICRPPFVQHGHHRIQILIWGTRAKVSRDVKVDLLLRNYYETTTKLLRKY
jgi:hypothetical protein